MQSNYSRLWFEKEKSAVQAFYARKFLSKGAVVQSTKGTYSRRFRLPIQMNAPSKTQQLCVGVILGHYNSPTKAGKYEGHPRPENLVAIILSRLSLLMNNPDEYDETFLAPNKETYSFVSSILERLKDKTPEHITSAFPAPIGDGGIFLQWKTDTGCIQLIVPPDPKKAFLYFRKGSESEIIREAIGDRLVDFLVSIA